METCAKSSHTVQRWTPVASLAHRKGRPLTDATQPGMQDPKAEAREIVPTAASVWLVMMKAHRSLQALMDRSIASLGIGLSDFMILEALLHKGSMPISVLGEKVHLANASMTAAIDRMGERGLVQRQSGEADRRVRTVELTPCGRALIEKLYRQHERDIDALMSTLCTAERAALRGSLKKVGLAAQAALQGT